MKYRGASQLMLGGMAVVLVAASGCSSMGGLQSGTEDRLASNRSSDSSPVGAAQDYQDYPGASAMGKEGRSGRSRSRVPRRRWQRTKGAGCEGSSRS